MTACCKRGGPMTAQVVLTSWKEIAAYLGKGVRTVQRWEAGMGLPVRRPGPERHIVLAYSAELDEWAHNGQLRPKDDARNTGHGIITPILMQQLAALAQLRKDLQHHTAEQRRLRQRLQEQRERVTTQQRTITQRLNWGGREHVSTKQS